MCKIYGFFTLHKAINTTKNTCLRQSEESIGCYEDKGDSGDNLFQRNKRPNKLETSSCTTTTKPSFSTIKGWIVRFKLKPMFEIRNKIITNDCELINRNLQPIFYLMFITNILGILKRNLACSKLWQYIKKSLYVRNSFAIKKNSTNMSIFEQHYKFYVKIFFQMLSWCKTPACVNAIGSTLFLFVMCCDGT